MGPVFYVVRHAITTAQMFLCILMVYFLNKHANKANCCIGKLVGVSGSFHLEKYQCQGTTQSAASDLQACALLPFSLELSVFVYILI